MNKYKKRFFLALVLLFGCLGLLATGAGWDRYHGFDWLDSFLPREGSLKTIVSQRVFNEDSGVVEIVERVGPSVVTVHISATRIVPEFNFDFGPFGFFGSPIGREEEIEQDIGTGFVVSEDGLVVTNKHVVSEQEAEYKVITTESREYKVTKIYRDPVNDLAILQIEADGLEPVELGDSSNLKVGQFVVAIGTALGFENTVTTGVISGLGRGIMAGSPYEGYVEELDNVIQTDAAINPGNSGGPLLNSLGQVIGVNVAVSPQGENIGFAIPIDVIKESLENFNQTGKFSRPYLGIRYRMIDRDLALMNEVPQGAYVVEVVGGTPADKAGVKAGEIITKFDGESLAKVEGGLAEVINKKKVGDEVVLNIWRDGEELEIRVKLEEFEGN